MVRVLGRRSFLHAGASALLVTPAVAWAGAPVADQPELPPIPLAVWIARAPGASSTPVVDAAFVDEQVAQSVTLFGAHGVRFREAEERRSAETERYRLESRADRDAMADLLLPGVLNVFFVESLRDVDDPRLYRMGVTWRKLSNLTKRYVIVAASARETTLAHELGHCFGNDHSRVTNNLMSYDRDGGAVFLDEAQGAKCRRAARGLFASGVLRST